MEGTAAAGAARPRRLLRHAGEVVWIGLAVVLGYLLWPSSLGGCTTLTIVSGTSMEPTYYTGDLVVSRCGDVEVGDVIVYSPPDVGGARVIHRIIGGDAEAGWVMQGDNNDFVDPWQPQGDHVLGGAVLHLPDVGKVASILLSPMTWISLLLIALAIVLWPGRPQPAEPAADLVDDDAELGADQGQPDDTGVPVLSGPPDPPHAAPPDDRPSQ